MSTLSTVGVPGAKSLEQLNAIASQLEDTLGPLVKIGNDTSKTLLVFETEDPPPAAQSLVLKITVAGHPIPQPGMTFLEVGMAIVTGQQALIAAYRKN